MAGPCAAPALDRGQSAARQYLDNGTPYDQTTAYYRWQLDVRQACRHGAPVGSWLERILARKPRMLVSVALANKMVRTVGALLTRQED